MAARVDLFDDDDAPQWHVDMRALWRLAAWGTGATLAAALAVLAGMSSVGSQRLAAIMSGKPDPARPAFATSSQMLARAPEVDGETRRLSDAVRVLAGDRDRMIARIATLEHALDDVTGSIARATAANRAPPPPAASSAPLAAQSMTPAAAGPPAAAAQANPPASTASAAAAASPPAPAVTPTAASATASAAALPKIEHKPPPAAETPATPPAPHAARTAPAQARPDLPPGWPLGAALSLQFPSLSLDADPSWSDEADNPATESVATRTEFGVDIGGGASVEALRALWIAAKAAHGALFEKLRPVVGIREVRPGFVELRLIVGPLGNAAAAARLCASLTTQKRACRPAAFDGQRLALR